MRKRKCFFGILTSMALVLTIPMMGFAQTGTEAAENGGEKIETVLVPQEQEENTEVYAKIYIALQEHKTSIALSKYQLTASQAMALYRQVINENADLFYVGSEADWEYDYENIDFENWNPDEAFVTEIMPQYGASREEIEPMKAEFQAAMEKALSGIDESMTDLDKALYLHDYIIQRSRFDWIGYQDGFMADISTTAYGSLVYGWTSTSGYAFAYSYLLKEVGIESQFIHGYTHAWNAIKLDGRYYYVDLHCDNPIKHPWGGGCSFDCVEHAFFLLGEEEMMVRNDALSHGWDHNTGIQVSRSSYEPFPFRDVSGPMCYYKGSWFYWKHLGDNMKNPAIMKTDVLSDMGNPIWSLDGFRWYTIGTGKIWKGYNGNIAISPERGKLYYCNSRQILSLDLDDLSARPKLVENVNLWYEYIYGLKVIDNKLIYGTAEAPYYEEYLSSIALDEVEEKEMLIGDLDGNGEIDAQDALMVLKREVDLQVADFEAYLGDCDEDGKITAKDALWILKKSVGLI